MQTPRDIYERYQIMPNLQEHQVRVAAVGKLICDSLKVPVDANTVILTALFHDMGNIIKFDLARFPEFVAEKGLPYWHEVKAEYEQKYGRDHDAATVAIAKELGLPENVVRAIGRVSFVNLTSVREDKGYEQKIVDYADLRVAPHGVLPIEDRIEEAHKRYLMRHPTDGGKSAVFEAQAKAAEDIERQIFEVCKIRPEEITNAAADPLMEELWKYPVP